jgi:hypothetical protein
MYGPCAQQHEDVLGNGGIAPRILNPGTRLRPLHPQRKSPRYPSDRRLGRPQSRSGRCAVQTNLLALAGIEPQTSSP